MSLPELLAADRALAAEITPPAPAEDELLIAAGAAAARHNGRLDAPVPTKNGWQAKVSGVRIDSEQGRHPWTTAGSGATAAAALEDLIAKLDARPVAANAVATCPTCGQPLPG